MADKSLIGKTAKPFTMPIEWGKVREFARAIKDRNPVYFDPEAAKKECGGIPIKGKTENKQPKTNKLWH